MTKASNGSEGQFWWWALQFQKENFLIGFGSRNLLHQQFSLNQNATPSSGNVMKYPTLRESYRKFITPRLPRLSARRCRCLLSKRYVFRYASACLTDITHIWPCFCNLLFELMTPVLHRRSGATFFYFAHMATTLAQKCVGFLFNAEQHNPNNSHASFA